MLAIDLFAGAGGASQGLRQAGFKIHAAIEIDSTAAASYALNHQSTNVLQRDIRSVAATDLRRGLGLDVGQLDLLKACPPCQGFSTLRRSSKAVDAQNDLILDVVRFVRAFLPRSVLIENVPGLLSDWRAKTFADRLGSLGYHVVPVRVEASEYGVPQVRRRAVVVALKGRHRRSANVIERLESIKSKTLITSKEVLRRLSSTDRSLDPLHRHRTLKAMTLKRIEAIPPGGGRFDLPDELQLDCHKRIKHRNATTSYGRLHLDEPAPTMTSRCTTPACGRFVHPTENRGLTLREAAAFQTFPDDYQFAGNYGEIESQIGNAVPVELSRRLGLAVAELLTDMG